MDEPDSSSNNTPRGLTRAALDANINLQTALTKKAQELEAQLKEIDRLLEAQEVEDEPESEIVIPGSKRAVGLFPSSEFLNPLSPFYGEANRRNTYIIDTHPRPMKEKDLEVLADAVKKENERLHAIRRSHTSILATEIEAAVSLDTNNLDGLDWNRIAERVSDTSSVKRGATECRVTWIANRPGVNRALWTPSELQQLHSLILEYPPNNVNWAKVAEKLGTNRIPIDCMRQEICPQRHYWTPDADQRLTNAVEKYGIYNWCLVATKVGEHLTPTQCQARWCKSLDPSLRRGAWTEEEDSRLRKAVAGYGTSWVQVATAIPGRTNDQCRERWTEHLNVGPQQAWTDEEDKILMAAVTELGAKWKKISLKVGNRKTGQACRRRYDKLKKAQKVQPSSPPNLSTFGSFPSTVPTPIMSFSQESAPMSSQAATNDDSSAQSASHVAATTELTPKPRPRPRPRQKKTNESSVTFEVSELTSATPASAPSTGEIQAISQSNQPESRIHASMNTETSETNPTSVGIDLEQNPTAMSRTEASTSERKRKAKGKPEADDLSKKTRRSRSGLTPQDSSTVDPATAAVNNTENTEVVKLRRGRSSGKVG